MNATLVCLIFLEWGDDTSYGSKLSAEKKWASLTSLGKRMYNLDT
jgi:hypothetical protein